MRVVLDGKNSASKGVQKNSSIETGLHLNNAPCLSFSSHLATIECSATYVNSVVRQNDRCPDLSPTLQKTNFSFAPMHAGSSPCVETGNSFPQIIGIPALPRLRGASSASFFLFNITVFFGDDPTVHIFCDYFEALG